MSRGRRAALRMASTLDRVGVGALVSRLRRGTLARSRRCHAERGPVEEPRRADRDVDEELASLRWSGDERASRRPDRS